MKLFTDGSCDLTLGIGGWAIVDEDTMRVVKSGGARGPTVTNNRMELTAVIEAVRLVTEDAAAIYTDSQYVAKGINSWLPTWIKNNFRTASKGPVKNQDLWIALKTALDEKLCEGRHIEIEWVRGHNGNEANCLADSACYEAMKNAK